MPTLHPHPDDLVPSQLLTDFRAAGTRLLDNPEPMTICDRCGIEIPVAEANYAGSELPTWEGATLCNECYAAEVST